MAAPHRCANRSCRRQSSYQCLRLKSRPLSRSGPGWVKSFSSAPFYFADGTAIHEIRPDGSVSTVVELGEYGISGGGLAVEGDGRIWLSNPEARRLRVLEPAVALRVLSTKPVPDGCSASNPPNRAPRRSVTTPWSPRAALSRRGSRPLRDWSRPRRCDAGCLPPTAGGLTAPQPFGYVATDAAEQEILHAEWVGFQSDPVQLRDDHRPVLESVLAGRSDRQCRGPPARKAGEGR